MYRVCFSTNFDAPLYQQSRKILIIKLIRTFDESCGLRDAKECAERGYVDFADLNAAEGLRDVLRGAGVGGADLVALPDSDVELLQEASQQYLAACDDLASMLLEAGDLGKFARATVAVRELKKTLHS